MPLPMICTNGHAFHSNAVVVFGGTNNTFGTVTENCPHCGAIARSFPGTYSHDEQGQIVEARSAFPHDQEFLNAVLGALRSPATTAEVRERVRVLAEAVKAGEISVADVEEEVSAWGAQFANLVALARKYNINPILIITLITMALQFYQIIDSNRVADQAHADATRIAIATEEQARATEAMLKMLSDERDAHAKKVSREKVARVYRQAPVRPAAKPNRHERRKAAKMSRKSK